MDAHHGPQSFGAHIADFGYRIDKTGLESRENLGEVGSKVLLVRE